MAVSLMVKIAIYTRIKFVSILPGYKLTIAMKPMPMRWLVMPATGSSRTTRDIAERSADSVQ